MVVREALVRVRQAAPGADLNDLLAVLGDCVREVTQRYLWPHFRKTYDFTPRQQYLAGTVVHDGDSMGASDGAFESAMVGAELSVVAGDVTDVAQVFEIATVVDAEQVTTTEAWSLDGQAGDVQMTVYQNRWPVPDDFRKLSALGRVCTTDEDLIYPLDDPLDYKFLRQDGAAFVQFLQRPNIGVTHRLVYYRKAELPSTPEDELDGNDLMVQAMYHCFEARVCERLAAGNEVAMADRDRRVSGARARYERYFTLARGEAAAEDARRRRNVTGGALLVPVGD